MLIYEAYSGSGLASDISVVATASGYCWTSSNSDDRPDAWRCLIGNFIHDPCFSNAAESQVACPSFGNVNAVTLINLTQPLPQSTANHGTGRVWMFQLDDGAYCAFSSGASTTIGGMRVNGGCTDNASWVGDIDQSRQPWSVYVQTKQSSTLVKENISKAWQ